ncbi:putative Zinc finger, BED-type [Corchorus olitorius]|uniref:Zinc finger, BED-type n=1 Tax=Corchorus olitorius TaxID=93759 RepID=A0A1R3I461_9ROSI|nr:putative Zinc finger, BED-type [Corchorus olitorius]
MSSSTPDVSSTPQQPEIGSSTSRAANQDQATRETYSANKEVDMIDLDDEEGGNVKKRAKTSNVWSEFKDVGLSNGVEVGEGVHCKKQLKKNKSKSTSQFKRHLESCVRRKIFQNQQKKITFQPKDVGDGDIQLQPALTNGRFDMAKMREAAARWILMHEHSFSIVEEEGFNMMQKRGMLICLTTDLWRSSNQKIEYMVLTAHFIDSNWRLQKRIISFVHIPPPRRGVEIADCIYKCLQEWGIKNKVFTISVDNAASNDVPFGISRILSQELESAILDPRCKMRAVEYSFSKMYSDEEARANLTKVRDALYEIYDEYVNEHLDGNDHSAETNVLDDDGTSGGNVKSHKSGMSEILAYVKTLYSGPPQESDLDAYLLEACFIHPGDPDQFDALEWWKANSLRFRILSQMARDILAIPITTVASEAAFSAGSRVIDTYRASLAPDTVQALLCGGDWCRNLHGVKKKNKNEKKSIEVELK